MSEDIRMITRHGETPEEWTQDKLKPFEMGWSTDEQVLYINDGDSFYPIGGKCIPIIIRGDEAPTSSDIPIPLTSVLWINTSNGRYIPNIYDDTDDEWHPLGAVYK